MRPGEKGAQRSAFSRMMAEKRVSALGGEDTAMMRNSTSCRGLPKIQPRHDPSARARGSASASLSSSWAVEREPYVISEETTHAELLAIIQRLQHDLTQRTDSVNAIQRNFERLSAMHRAEQSELERLRQFEKEHQESNEADAKAKLAALQQSVVDLQKDLRVHHEVCSELKGQLAAAQAAHKGAGESMQLMQAHLEARRELEREEDANFILIHDAALAQRIRQEVRYSILQQLNLELVRLIDAHQAQIAATLGSNGHTALGVADQEPLVHAPLTVLLEAIHQRLSVTQDAVRRYAFEVQERQELRAQQEITTQQKIDEERRCRSQHQLCAGLLVAAEQEEATARHALLFGELSASTQLREAWSRERRGIIAAAEKAYARVGVEADARVGQMLRQVEEWTVAVDTRMAAFRDTCDACFDEFARQEERAGQQAMRVAVTQTRAQLEHQFEQRVEALRVEWSTQLEAERREHEQEVAGVRGKLLAQLDADAAASHRAAAERRLAWEAELTEKEEAHTRAMQEAKLHGRQQTVEAVKACEQRWRLTAEQDRTRYAEGMRHLAELHGVLLQSRARCAHEEQEARRAMMEEYAFTCQQLTRRAGAAREEMWRYMSSQYVLAIRIGEEEALQRGRILGDTATSWAALLTREVQCRMQQQHAAALADVQGRMEQERAEAKQRELDLQLLGHTLRDDLCRAKRERLEAVERGADAVLAAQDAQTALQAAELHFTRYKSAVCAAAGRIEAAESATESACSCSVCLQLYTQPVVCVPCGHTYCASCLLLHPRNRSLSPLTAQLPTRVGGGQHTVVELTRWQQSVPTHVRLYCPECESVTVTAVAELRVLGDLAAKYSYKKQALTELLRGLRQPSLLVRESEAKAEKGHG